MFVLKDLVVDMTNFYSQYKTIQPYLKRKEQKAEGVRFHLFSKENIIKVWKIEKSLMDFTSAFYVPAAQHLAHLTGGTLTSILVPQS